MRNKILASIVIFVLALNSSCVLLAYQALALRTEPARGTFPESSQYSRLDGRIYYNSWGSAGKLYQERLGDANSDSFRVVVLENGVITENDRTNLYLKGKELYYENN